MEPFISPATNNYAYRCSNCDLAVEVSVIVPRWSDHFEYFGYALDSDQVTQSPRRLIFDPQKYLVATVVEVPTSN